VKSLEKPKVAFSSYFFSTTTTILRCWNLHLQILLHPFIDVWLSHRCVLAMFNSGTGNTRRFLKHRITVNPTSNRFSASHSPRNTSLFTLTRSFSPENISNTSIKGCLCSIVPFSLLSSSARSDKQIDRGCLIVIWLGNSLFVPGSITRCPPIRDESERFPGTLR